MNRILSLNIVRATTCWILGFPLLPCGGGGKNNNVADSNAVFKMNLK